MLHKLGRLSLLLSTALLAATTHASIVYQPGSIVQSADGTYITDTVNNLDWYKFSNAQSTIGLSMNAVSTLFASSNWSVASRTQVQGLQSQFGWTADTLGSSSNVNANFGLTQAMGDALGLTASYLLPHDGLNEFGERIEAMTSDFGFVVGDQGELQEYRFTTFSQSTNYLGLFGPGQDYLFGDYVDGSHRPLQVDAGENGVGTWLSRAHVADTGGVGGGGGAGVDCGRLAPCPNHVPEPASFGLVGAALLGLGFTRRRRRDGLLAAPA